MASSLASLMLPLDRMALMSRNETRPRSRGQPTASGSSTSSHKSAGRKGSYSSVESMIIHKMYELCTIRNRNKQSLKRMRADIGQLVRDCGRIEKNAEESERLLLRHSEKIQRGIAQAQNITKFISKDVYLARQKNIE